MPNVNLNIKIKRTIFTTKHDSDCQIYHILNSLESATTVCCLTNDMDSSYTSPLHQMLFNFNLVINITISLPLQI